jgi:hypothetical protein
MARQFMPTKRRVLILVGILVLIMLFAISIKLILHKSPKKIIVAETLSSVTKNKISPTSQTDDYIKAVKNYAEKTNDPKEKAKSYQALGDAYNLRSDYKNAVDAYKKVKLYYDAAGYNVAQKTVVDNEIALAELQVNKKPYTGADNVNVRPAQ